jgi:Phosphoglyceromutase
MLTFMSIRKFLRIPSFSFVFAVLFAGLFLFLLSAPIVFGQNISDGIYQTDFSDEYVMPNGAVFLIVDGFGSYYIFPELSGETLNGEPIGKSKVPTLSKIWENGFRVSQMKVPVPVTDKGHSVLVTGNPNADPEMVGYSDASFLDVFQNEGYLCIGIMQRGDFESMRKKFDIIIYDKTNSVNNMDFTVQVNNYDASESQVVREIESVFESQKKKASSYIDSKDTGEKYAGYNRWGLDTAYETLLLLDKYPNQKFIIVINVGAIDSTGHYRGYYAYLDAIERLDADLKKLYDICVRKNLFFILTADHGMSFEAQDKKAGGHSSSKYAKTKEALHIPFIISGASVKKGSVYFEETGQADAAPTLLSLFNIYTPPRFLKGDILPAKECPTLHVSVPDFEEIRLYKISGLEETLLFTSTDLSDNYSVYSLSGLSAGNYRLTWDGGGQSYSQTEVFLFLEKEMSVDLSTYLKKPLLPPFSSPVGSNGSASASGLLKFPAAKLSGYGLIAFINLVGAALIYRYYKKE